MERRAFVAELKRASFERVGKVVREHSPNLLEDDKRLAAHLHCLESDNVEDLSK